MSQPPNILFILTDHQAFYGHDRPDFCYRWPIFERFCSEGTRFDRAYCVAPLCTPARSSMMTGLYPSTHGLISNTEARGGGENLVDFHPDQKLYSHYLSGAGYRNAYVGKWHCGHERLPVDYGIEGWSLPDYGKTYMAPEYKAYAEKFGYPKATALIENDLKYPEREGRKHVLEHESPWHFMNGSGVMEGPPEVHESFFVAHLACGKIKELARGSQPWSLVASFWGPHQPYFPNEPYASMVDPKSIPMYPSFRDDLKGRPLRHLWHRDFEHRSSQRWADWAQWQPILARAYGQGYQTDAAIGKILKTLEENGGLENTLVIWTADHGDSLACHGGLWDKGSTYTEEVARIPLAVRWPKAFNGGLRSRHLVSNMDVTATLLDAAGVRIPEEMHSRSLLPICREAKASWPDHVITEHHGKADRIIQRAIICENHKYIAALYDDDEMYDLEKDPCEMKNIIGDPEYLKVRLELREKLIRHLEKYGGLKSPRLIHKLKLVQ